MDQPSTLTFPGLTLHAVAAMSENRVIGRDGSMPWHYPKDLKFFKNLTLHHPIVMGRKTWDSLNGKPLPNRRNIVLTRRPGPLAGAEVIHTPTGLNELPDLHGQVFIIGGGEIYSLFLPHTHLLTLTHFPETEEGDAFFPEYTHLFPNSQLLEKDERCRWVRYSR